MHRHALNSLIRIMEARPRLMPDELAKRLDRELKIGPTAARELVAWIVDNRYLAACQRTGELCVEPAHDAIVAARAGV